MIKIENKNEKWKIFLFAALSVLLLSSIGFPFSSSDSSSSSSSVPGIVSDSPTVFLPGQGMQLYYLGDVCDGCPPPDALYPGMSLGNDVEKMNASVTLFVETQEDGRIAVEDATIFVKVIYGEGSSEFCRLKTDSLGEGVLNYGMFPLCDEQGCTLRFTFCCPDLEEGGCLIPTCLGEPSLISYDLVSQCPGYEHYATWPQTAIVEDEFVPLYPVIDELYIPPPVPDVVSGFSFAFCLPILVIFGLLAAGMFASGRNPFAAFSFYTPRFKRGTGKMIRARGRTWNIHGIINKLTQSGTGITGFVKSATSKTKSGRGMTAKTERGTFGTAFKATGFGQFTQMTNLVKGKALKGGGKFVDQKTGATIGGRSDSLSKAAGTFGKLSKGAKTTMGAIAIGVTGATMMVSLATVTRMSQMFAPLGIIVAGNQVLGIAGLSNLISGAIEKAGADPVSEVSKAQLGSYNITTNEEGNVITYTKDGETKIIAFTNDDDGMKKKAEFLNKLMGEDEIVFATAAGLAAPIVIEKAQSSAQEFTTEQRKEAAENISAGEWGGEAQNTLNKYDTDGKTGISAKELQAAMSDKDLKPEQMGILIVAAEDRGEIGVPPAYEQYVIEQVKSGKLTNQEAAVAALILNGETPESQAAIGDLLAGVHIDPATGQIPKENISNLAEALVVFQNDELSSAEDVKGRISDAQDSLYLATCASATASALDQIVDTGEGLQKSILAGELIDSGFTALDNVLEVTEKSVLPSGGAKRTDFADGSAMQETVDLMAHYGNSETNDGHPAAALEAVENRDLANALIRDRVETNAFYGLEGSGDSDNPNTVDKLEAFAKESGIMGKYSAAEISRLKEEGKNPAPTLSEKRDNPSAFMNKGDVKRWKGSEHAKAYPDPSALVKEGARREAKKTLGEQILREKGIDPIGYAKAKLAAERMAALEPDPAKRKNLIETSLKQFTGGIGTKEYHEATHYARAEAAKAFDSQDPKPLEALVRGRADEEHSGLGVHKKAGKPPGDPNAYATEAREWFKSGEGDKYLRKEGYRNEKFDEPLESWKNEYDTKSKKHDAIQPAEQKWVSKVMEERPGLREGRKAGEDPFYSDANYFEEHFYAKKNKETMKMRDEAKREEKILAQDAKKRERDQQVKDVFEGGYAKRQKEQFDKESKRYKPSPTSPSVVSKKPKAPKAPKAKKTKPSQDKRIKDIEKDTASAREKRVKRQKRASAATKKFTEKARERREKAAARKAAKKKKAEEKAAKKKKK